MSLTETSARGHQLCVFEQLVRIAPVGAMGEVPEHLSRLSCACAGRAHGECADLLERVSLC